MFHFIKRGDGRLITLNLAALLVIAFMPYPYRRANRSPDATLEGA
jgi:uncharacterized membrane protein